MDDRPVERAIHPELTEASPVPAFPHVMQIETGGRPTPGTGGIHYVVLDRRAKEVSSNVLLKVQRNKTCTKPGMQIPSARGFSSENPSAVKNTDSGVRMPLSKC